MENIKNKYEIILGFATLIISLSAFKDELKLITLDLGFLKLTVADYLLYCIYGFSLCIYLYILENVFRDTKVGRWKVWNYLLKIGFFLFVFVLITPLLLLLSLIINYCVNRISHLTLSQKEIVAIILNVVGIGASLISASYNITQIIRRNWAKQKEEIEEQEIKELDNAEKLFKDGYYSHSVLESFKVLETHLYKKIIERNKRVARYRINDIINIAYKERIIEESDLPYISDIRAMRNATAHSDAEQTKQAAESALTFVRNLLKRNN